MLLFFIQTDASFLFYMFLFILLLEVKGYKIINAFTRAFCLMKVLVDQVTNDIFTKEDGEFLVKHGALPEDRIRAIETGGCPHAAIREDISINLGPLEELSNLYKADLLLCESGGGMFC